MGERLLMNRKQKLTKMLLKKSGYDYNPYHPEILTKQVIHKTVMDGLKVGVMSKKQMIEYLQKIIKEVNDG